MCKENPLFHASTLRPAFVDAAAHDAIKDYIPRPHMMYAAGGVLLGPAIRVGMKGFWSRTEPLGKFLTGMAMQKLGGDMEGPGIEKLGKFPVIENVAFRRLMGLHK